MSDLATKVAEEIHEYVCLRCAKVAGSPHYDWYDFIPIITEALAQARLTALEEVRELLDSSIKVTQARLTVVYERDVSGEVADSVLHCLKLIDSLIKESKDD